MKYHKKRIVVWNETKKEVEYVIRFTCEPSKVVCIKKGNILQIQYLTYKEKRILSDRSNQYKITLVTINSCGYDRNKELKITGG